MIDDDDGLELAEFDATFIADREAELMAALLGAAVEEAPDNDPLAIHPFGGDP
jgi:hypothetical protein